MLSIKGSGVIKSQIASQLFRSTLRLRTLKSGFNTKFYLYKVMQDQDFTKDQNLENSKNQETNHVAPEVETVPHFNLNANETEQETVVFARPAEDDFNAPSAAHNVSTDDEELFGKYEIKSWNWTPRIYKIFAASAIFNILFLVAVAQTDVLRTKACDSPLVGGFCQVIDTLYVGGKILGEDGEWTSADYEKTQIEDADIVWVNKDGMEPPLTYPAGYFQIANPENYMLPEQVGTSPFDTSGFPSTVTPMPTNPTVTNPTFPTSPNNNSILNRKPRVPKVKGNEIPLDLPDGININPTEDAKIDPKNPKTTKDETTAETKPEPEKPKQPGLQTMPVAEEAINKKPLQDFGNVVLDKVAKKEVDLNKEFSIVMVGTITDEGKFDQKKSAYLNTSGDQAMVDVAKSAVEAIGDSGILKYLKAVDINQIKFELVQNDKEIYVVITSDQKSENSARTISSSLNGYLTVGKMTVKEEDTLALLNASKVESKGKTFLLNFKLEKPFAQEMIKRQLEKAEAKRKLAEEAKPNSTAQKTNTQENAGK